MASENGFGRRLASFFGINVNNDDYDDPQEYAPSNTMVPARSSGRSGGTSRTALPARAGASSGGRRRIYGEDDDGRRGAYRDDDRDSYAERSQPRYTSRFVEPEPPRRSARNNSQAMVPQRSSARAGSSGRTVMIDLMNLRDANRVITSLVRGNTIVMTLVTSDPLARQRIVDTLSGAAYALDASIRKASDSTYLLAPRAVDVQSARDSDDRY